MSLSDIIQNTSNANESNISRDRTGSIHENNTSIQSSKKFDNNKSFNNTRNRRDYDNNNNHFNNKRNNFNKYNNNNGYNNNFSRGIDDRRQNRKFNKYDNKNSNTEDYNKISYNLLKIDNLNLSMTNDDLRVSNNNN